MKKLLLSLGALSAVVAPVAAVVACGSKTETPAKQNADHTIKVNVTSTKTLAELKAVTVGTATNAADWTTKLGVSVSSGGTTTFTWDANALTLTENQKVAGKTLVTILTITPKAQTPAEVATDIVTKMLSDTGYSMTDAAKTKLVTYLMTSSNNDVLSFGKAFAGIFDGTSKTGTHGSDDFAVIINGKARTLEEGKEFGVDAKDGTIGNHINDEKAIVYKAVPQPDNFQYAISENLGDSEQKDAKFLTQDAKWGFDATEFSNARFVIYLQTNGATSTLEVAEVVKFKGETHLLNDPINSGNANYFAKMHPGIKNPINDFATHSFTATKDKATLNS